jgi:hypothetical protein
MRSLVVVCLFAGVAAADPVGWDGSYEFDGNSSGNGLCPRPADDSTITVTDNAFVIVWNIRGDDDSLVRVGTLGVTVRPNGATTVTPKLDEPFLSRVKAALAYQDASPAKLRKLASKIQVQLEADSTRELHLTSSDNCDSTWSSALPSHHDDPPAVTAKAPPRSTAALPAGSPIWDQPYKFISGYEDDAWTCPEISFDLALVVSKGHFSIPYIIRIAEGYDRLTVGTLEGSVAANGKVTLRVSFLDKLPAKSIAQSPAKERTLDELRAAPTLTMTFEKGDGPNRYAKLTTGPKCIRQFQNTSTFKQGHAHGKIDGAQCTRDGECTSLSCVANVCRAR